MTNRTLLKIEVLEHCITFRTVSRKRKSGMFYLTRKELGNLIANNYIITRDCYSFAEWYLDLWANILRVNFYWLKGGDDCLSGYREHIEVNWDRLTDITTAGAGAEGSILAIDTDRRHRPKYIFKGNNLSKAVANKTIRHKLSRVMAYNFGWPDAATITFYDDFTPYSFYWKERRIGGSEGMNGGVIFHNYGDLKKAYYGIHT